MKKYFYLVFVAIVAAMSITLASCDNDDDWSNGDPSENGMKLSTLTEEDGSWSEYLYDSKGRVSQVKQYDKNGQLHFSTTVEYNANNIVVTTYSDDRLFDRDVCTLNAKGQIIKSVCSDGGDSEYTYNDQGQMINIYFAEYDHNTTLVWENGNLVKALYGDDAGFICEYSSIPLSKGFVIFGDDVLIDVFSDYINLPLLANCGYFGKLPQNMLSSLTYYEGNSRQTFNYTYELDKDGYVSNILSDNDHWPQCTLTWK